MDAALAMASGWLTNRGSRVKTRTALTSPPARAISLGLRRDLHGVTREPVQRLGQWFHVLDQPGDAVLQQGAHRVRDQGESVEPRAHRTQRAVDPGAVPDTVDDLLDVLGDPHTRPGARPL